MAVCGSSKNRTPSTKNTKENGHLLVVRSFVGILIRNERLKAEMSQTKLAKACGIDTGTISRIETGKQMASDDTKDILASKLHVSSIAFSPKINIWPSNIEFSREYTNEEMVDIIEDHCNQCLGNNEENVINEQFMLLKQCCESVRLELRYRTLSEK